MHFLFSSTKRRVADHSRVMCNTRPQVIKKLAFHHWLRRQSQPQGQSGDWGLPAALDLLGELLPADVSVGGVSSYNSVSRVTS